VTKQVSQSHIPRIHQVIPFIDALFDALEDEAVKLSNFPAVRMAAKRGRAMLSKYYGFTDYTSIYRIAMSKFNHPRLCGKAQTAQHSACSLASSL
jgi:hypothetical protein